LMLQALTRKYFTFYSSFDESMFERVCMIYIYINLFSFFSFFSELAKMNRSKYVFASQWFCFLREYFSDFSFSYLQVLIFAINLN
jgi:hypothetical protein